MMLVLLIVCNEQFFSTKWGWNKPSSGGNLFKSSFSLSKSYIELINTIKTKINRQVFILFLLVRTKMTSALCQLLQEYLLSWV